MSNKIYCGIKEVPEGKKLGTATQCASLGKVSYYGLKKIDQSAFEETNEVKQLKKRYKKLHEDYSFYKGKLKNLESKHYYAKTKEAKDKYNLEHKEAAKKYNDIVREMTSIKKKTKL